MVLVVGDNTASRWWFHALPRAGHPTLRHFITGRAMAAPTLSPGGDRDCGALGRLLHVRPSELPAFLVCVDGWIVDWFVAPTPPTGASPTAVHELLAPHLSRYS